MPTPFGTNLTHEDVPRPLWYGGYIEDRDLQTPGEYAGGWYWLSVRSYDPTLERFLQPDPSEQEGTRSYVYCGNDPLDCTDPSGLLLLEDVFTGIGVGLVAVGTAVLIGVAPEFGIPLAAGADVRLR